MYNIGYCQSDSLSKGKLYDRPLFNGGDINDFKQYMQGEVIYPEEAIILNLEGKTYYRFLINFSKTASKRIGIVDSIQIVKSLNPILDSVALNIIKNSKEWTTGFSRGNGINTWIVIPVSYQKPKMPKLYYISKIGNEYSLNNIEDDYLKGLGIHETIIKGLLNIVPIVPSYNEKCKIQFSINDDGYINEFVIIDNENAQFKSFINTYFLSLPKIRTQIQKYISDDKCLQVLLDFTEKGIAVSQVEVVLKDSAFHRAIYLGDVHWQLPVAINSEILNSDSAQIKTTFEYPDNRTQEINIFKTFNKHNVSVVKYIKLENSVIEKEESVYYYHQYSEKKSNYTEYSLIYNSLSPKLKINKIDVYIKKEKKPVNAQSMVKTHTFINIINDTINKYSYYENLGAKGKWFSTSNSYSKSLESGKLIEEGFQITRGLFETQFGDNSDILKYYGKNIIVRMIKRNEGEKTIVYIKKNNKSFVYRIEDFYDDFSNILNSNIRSDSFEEYLQKEEFEFYKSVQFINSSDLLVKEKILKKSYYGTTQVDRLIDYQYINNCN